MKRNYATTSVRLIFSLLVKLLVLKCGGITEIASSCRVSQARARRRHLKRSKRIMPN